MSGPKLSQAELERMRAEQLERERMAALKRLQEAQGAYRKECAKAGILKEKASQLLSRTDAVYRADAEVRVQAALDRIRIRPVADTKDPESYDAARTELAKIIQEAAGEIGGILKTVADRTVNDKKQNDANAVYQSFQSTVNGAGREIGAVKIAFGNSYDKECIRRQLDAMRVHFEVQEDCTDVPDLRGFSAAAVSRIKGLLSQDLDVARSEMQRIANEEAEILRICDERRDLYNEYAALASMTDRIPRDPGEFESAAAIRAEISELRDLYRQQDEMDYIADQINDAMVELGYTFVTSRVLTKKDQGETDFSLYQADRETGVAVYTDQTGAVMMRMTVLGDDPVITEADRDFSYQRQIDFCAGHPDIVAALAGRGVLLKQRNYREPDRAYTYKINIQGQKTAANTGSTKKDAGVQKADRRRRRAGSKRMHAV